MTKQLIYKMVSRVFLLFFCFFAVTLNSCNISFDFYLLGNKITVFFWFVCLILTLILSMLFEYRSLKIQAKDGLPAKKIVNHLIVFFLIAAGLFLFLSFITVSMCSRSDRAMDARIKTAMAQLGPVMMTFGTERGNFDGFSCQYNTKTDALCREVDRMYTKRTDNFFEIRMYNSQREEDGAEPIIATHPVASSTEACVYSPLNEKNGATWFCADSQGNSGVTNINPANGYCVDGVSAKCPPGMTD